MVVIELTSKQQDDEHNLRRLAWIVMGILLVLVTGAVAASAWLLDAVGDVAEPRTNPRVIALCVTAATLGSAVSALISAADRYAHGFELADGTKLPQAQPADKFVERMAPWFLIRPFLGAAMGLLVYVGVVGGYLIAVDTDDEVRFNPHSLAFLSFLGGLFAKTLLEKLRKAVDALVT